MPILAGLASAAAIRAWASSDGAGDRLLHQHRHPGGQGVDRHRHMLMMRGADVHHIRAHLVEQGAMVGKARDPVLGGRRLQGGGVAVAHRHQLGAGNGLDRLEMHDRHRTAPDDRNPGHWTPSL